MTVEAQHRQHLLTRTGAQVGAGFYGQVVKGGGASGAPPCATPLLHRVAIAIVIGGQWRRFPTHGHRPAAGRPATSGQVLGMVQIWTMGVVRLTTASAAGHWTRKCAQCGGVLSFRRPSPQRGTGCSRCTSSGEVVKRHPMPSRNVTPSAQAPGIPGTSVNCGDSRICLLLSFERNRLAGAQEACCSNFRTIRTYSLVRARGGCGETAGVQSEMRPLGLGGSSLLRTGHRGIPPTRGEPDRPASAPHPCVMTPRSVSSWPVRFM